MHCSNNKEKRIYDLLETSLMEFFAKIMNGLRRKKWFPTLVMPSLQAFKTSASLWVSWKYSVRKKCPYSELFWSAFSRIRTEYGYSVSLCILSEWGKIRTRITPNTDTSHAVIIEKGWYFINQCKNIRDLAILLVFQGRASYWFHDFRVLE